MERRKLIACLLASVSLATCLIAAEQETSSKFMEFREDGAGGGTLDAEIVSYQNADGATVDLVAAVHVADEAYYDQLNKRFKHYDSVLYEMVKPAGMEMPRPGARRADSPVSSIQRMLKNVLELDFQLDTIDYTADNFVHADLDVETFQQLQQERGETLFQLMLRALMNDIMRPRAGGQALTLEDLLTAAASPDRARQLKLLLAPQFQDMEAIVAGFGDANGESVIITERNKAAINVLEQRLSQGDENLAIFYGAAHLPDMEKRLNEMGFHRVGSEWLTAWEMREKQDDSDREPILPQERQSNQESVERI